MKKFIRPGVIPAIFVMLVVAATAAFTGCGSNVPDITDYESEEVLITGLEEEDFSITPAQLLELECVGADDEGKSEKAGSVRAYGPSMDTFLAGYGKKQTDFYKIKFYAKDEYKKTIWGDMLTDCQIILSVANGDEALSEGEQPLRILVPGAESSYWVYGVVKIEFVVEEAATEGEV